MKKLLAFFLCVMLAVPSAGMNVSAAQDTDGKKNAAASETRESEDPVEQSGKISTNGSSRTTDGAGDSEDPKERADKAAQDAAYILNEHYRRQSFTDEEKTDANKIMVQAAEKLGLTFDETTGRLKDDPEKQTVFNLEENVADYVKETKERLSTIKTSSEPENPDNPDNPEEPDTSSANSNIIIGGKEYDTTIANAGQECEIAVPLVNLGNTTVTNVTITPALSSEVESWPFEISRTDYSKVWDELEGEDSGKEVSERKHTFRWTLKTRDDAITGYTKLVFNVSYNEADGTKGSVALDYYVQVNGVAPKTEEGDGKTSTPRVIVTGFTTTPEEVYAGDTFTLTLNLKNTSKATSVRNMLFDIQGTQEGTDAQNTYAAFLPTAGSSTIYVESIAANSSKSITIELKSKADLAQKPYVVTVDMEYEDANANAYTETASVSVPIKQEAKLDISSITLMPESVEIGNEANVMFSIYNVGKTKLYNVNAKFEADSVSGGDTFIGNLEPGATGNVDAYLAAETATMDDGTVKILITYEDEEGKEATIEKTMTLYVSEPYYEESIDDPEMMEGMEEKGGIPGWGIALIVAALIISGVVVFLVLKKKKRAKLQKKEELEAIESLGDIESPEDSEIQIEDIEPIEDIEFPEGIEPLEDNGSPEE